MNINKLFIIAMMCSLCTLASSAQDETIADSLITVDHTLSNDTIFTRGSGHSPDRSTITINITGKGSVPRRNVDVVLVMDISNSMAGSHLSAAKNAAKKFVQSMDESRDKIGFVAFNSGLGPNLAPGAAFGDVIKVINATQINRNSNEGDTCLSIGLNEAIKMLSDKDDSLKAIVFLSDGNNITCTKIEDPCADAARARDLGIIIYSVGINDSGKGTEYLRCMAETTGGSYFSDRYDNLESIYRDLARNMPYIIAKNSMMYYEIPDNIDLEMNAAPKDVGRYIYNIGTISSNQIISIPLIVSSKNEGTYPLGIFPDSFITFVDYNGTKKEANIPQLVITINSSEDSKPISRISNLNSPFSVTANGKQIEFKDPITGVIVRKIIDNNEISNLPRVTIQIITPPVKYADFILAVDSSGSMLQDGGESAIREAIPRFLERVDETNLVTGRVSIVSWDDNFDFAFGDNISNDYHKIKLIPINKSIEGAKKFFDFKNKYYYCNETEATLFDEGLKPSVEILKNNPPLFENNTSRFIILLTGPSEFKNCSNSILSESINQSYKIGTMGINVKENSHMWYVLNKISESTGANISRNPSSYSGDVAKQLEDELYYLSKELLNRPVADEIVIIDTLYPYLIPDKKSIKGATLRPSSKDTNADGTRTLDLIIEDGLKPNTTWNVSFDFIIDMRLPAEVQRAKRTNIEYHVSNDTPNSIIFYDWKLDEVPVRYSMDLPENEIRLTTCPLKEDPSFTNKDPEKAPMDFGFIMLFLITAMLIRRKE